MLIDRSLARRRCGPEWAALRARLAAMPRPVFPLEGRDVLALGEPEGPRVGALLRAVRQWWLDGGCVADKSVPCGTCAADVAARENCLVHFHVKRPRAAIWGIIANPQPVQ